MKNLKFLFSVIFATFFLHVNVHAQKSLMSEIHASTLKDVDSLENLLNKKGNNVSLKELFLLEYKWMFFYNEKFGSKLNSIYSRLQEEKKANMLSVYHLLNGIYLMRSANQSNAIQQLNTSLTAFEKLKDTTGIILSLSSLANMHLNYANTSTRDPNRALPYIEKALSLAQKFKNKDLLLVALNAQMTCYAYLKGNRKRVEEIAEKQFEIIGDIPELQYRRAYVVNNLGKYYYEEGNFQKIYELLKGYLPSAKKEMDFFNYNGVLANFAEVCLSLNKTEEAKLIYDEIIKASNKNNKLLKFRKAAFDGLSSKYAKGENYKEALVYADSSMDVLYRINKIDKIEEVIEIEEKFKNKEIKAKNDSLIQQNKLIVAKNRSTTLALISSVLLLLLCIFMVYYLLKSRKLAKQQSDEIIKLSKIRDQYINLIAHDLRSPISAMHQMYQLMKSLNEKKKFKELEKISNYIDEAGIKTNVLIENLFKWGSFQKEHIVINKKAINVQNFIEEILGFFSPLKFIKNFSTNLNCEPDIYLNLDPDCLNIIIRNIVDNAIKGLRENEGLISIDVLRTQESAVTIEITDNGVGVEPSKLELIRNVFENPHVEIINHEKLGMGTALIGRYVRVCEGQIEIASKVDTGTTVKITFQNQIID